MNTNGKIAIISLSIVCSVLFVLTVVFGIQLEKRNAMLETRNETVQLYSYEDLTTALDAQNRLHILFYKNNRTIILTDTVALAIHAQVSNMVYKDYLEKQKK